MDHLTFLPPHISPPLPSWLFPGKQLFLSSLTYMLAPNLRPQVSQFSSFALQLSESLWLYRFLGLWKTQIPDTFRAKPDASLCPNYFLLLTMIQMIRDWAFTDVSSELSSTDPLSDPLSACLGSLICKMDIMTDRERMITNQVCTRLTRYHCPSSQEKLWKTPPPHHPPPARCSENGISVHALITSGPWPSIPSPLFQL